jgi:Secretion system C-terminal sorting domain
LFSKSFYRIRLTRKNGQLVYSNIIMVNKVAGVDISVYPNPASEALVVAGLKEHGWLSIFTASGQRVIQKNINANSISIDVSNLQGGIYFLEISGKTVTRRTFVIQ